MRGLVKFLKAQVSQNLLAMLRIRRFPLRDVEHQGGRQTKLMAHVMDNGEGERMDLGEKTSITTDCTEL
jgi:hypothetical protein